MTTRLMRRREHGDGEWKNIQAYVGRERKQWQALYAVVGELPLALKVKDDIIIWPQGVSPPNNILTRWATNIQWGDDSVEPALEKLMEKAWERYKSNKHWRFIEGQIDAANKVAQDIIETGRTKQPVIVSYLGANANYGMDKGSHAQQGVRSQQLNIGNVRIISNRSQPAISASATKKAKKLMAPPKEKPVEAVYRVVE